MTALVLQFPLDRAKARRPPSLCETSFNGGDYTMANPTNTTGAACDGCGRRDVVLRASSKGENPFDDYCAACFDALESPRFSPSADPPSPLGSGALRTQAQAQAQGQSQRRRKGLSNCWVPQLRGDHTEGRSRREKNRRAADDEKKREPNHLEQLLDLHRRGELQPDPIDGLGPLPPRPTRADRRLHEFLVLAFGLFLADGVCEPMMLAVRVVVAQGIIGTPSGASKLLHRFERHEVIWSPGSMMKANGQPYGTRLFLPGPMPTEPEAEIGWRDRVIPAAEELRVAA